MHLEITDNLPAVKLYQYPFSKKEQEFITAEIKTLLTKSVILEQSMNQANLFHPYLFLKNLMGGFRLILSLERLN